MPVSPCCFTARGVNAQKYENDHAIDHDPHSKVNDDTGEIDRIIDVNPDPIIAVNPDPRRHRHPRV
jgi:hypothetical protein